MCTCAQQRVKTQNPRSSIIPEAVFRRNMIRGSGVRDSRGPWHIGTPLALQKQQEQAPPAHFSDIRDAPSLGFLTSARGCHRGQGFISGSRVRVSRFIPSVWGILPPSLQPRPRFTGPARKGERIFVVNGHIKDRRVPCTPVRPPSDEEISGRVALSYAHRRGNDE